MYARAPARISFAGGGTDLLPYMGTYGGITITGAINKYAYASISDTFRMFNPSNNGDTTLIEACAKNLGTENKANVRIEVPPFSGLGASASISVATIGCLAPTLQKEDVARLACDVERKDLGVTGGYQDQYISACGGMCFLTIDPDYVEVDQLQLPKPIIWDLEKHCILVFVQSREKVSGSDVLKDQIERVQCGETVELHHQLKSIAQDIRDALLAFDMNSFAELLKQEWRIKKQVSPLISNSFIDGLFEFALKAGAQGGKLLGAGGGGFFLFYAFPDRESELIHNLQQLGFHPEHIQFDFDGLVRWQV